MAQRPRLPCRGRRQAAALPSRRAADLPHLEPCRRPLPARAPRSGDGRGVRGGCRPARPRRPGSRPLRRKDGQADRDALLRRPPPLDRARPPGRKGARARVPDAQGGGDAGELDGGPPTLGGHDRGSERSGSDLSPGHRAQPGDPALGIAPPARRLPARRHPTGAPDRPRRFGSFGVSHPAAASRARPPAARPRGPWRPVGPGPLGVRSGSTALREPRLRGASGQLPWLDGLRQEVRPRREKGIRPGDADRSARRRRLGGEGGDRRSAEGGDPRRLVRRLRGARSAGHDARSLRLRCRLRGSERPRHLDRSLSALVAPLPGQTVVSVRRQPGDRRRSRRLAKPLAALPNRCDRRPAPDLSGGQRPARDPRAVRRDRRRPDGARRPRHLPLRRQRRSQLRQPRDRLRRPPRDRALFPRLPRRPSAGYRGPRDRSHAPRAHANILDRPTGRELRDEPATNRLAPRWAPRWKEERGSRRAARSGRSGR